MQADILTLSDKFSGVDPVVQAAQATLDQSRLPIEKQHQARSKEHDRSTYMSPSPLQPRSTNPPASPALMASSQMFDQLDKNGDGVLDRSEFRAASSAMSTPALPQAARPALQTDYLELRKKLLGKK